GLRGMVELIAIYAGEVATADWNDLGKHWARTLLHGVSEHANLAASAIQGTEFLPQGFSSQHFAHLVTLSPRSK
ncbi:MAG TPA: hypothetical protein VG672_07570, partial [Bryobacteraceae bacterium]|nr:hypothetical protein [Bryobacteraceae bacterium]